MLEIKGMRATFSSSLFLETVGLKPKKNLEISRSDGGELWGECKGANRRDFRLFGHGFEGDSKGKLVQFFVRFSSPFWLSFRVRNHGGNPEIFRSRKGIDLG